MNIFIEKWYIYLNWWSNAKNFHHRVMMRFLKKRGWVVFYLAEQHRVCSNPSCWINLYNDAQSRQGHFITKTERD